MKKIIVAYVPVLHEGYMRFFAKHKSAGELYLIGPEIVKEYKPLTKDLRALDPKMMKKAIAALKIFKKIEIVGPAKLKSLAKPGRAVVMPDEDVMHELHEKHFAKANVAFDSIFLRWDKHKSFEGRPVNADQVISKADFDVAMMEALKLEATKSSDFWRHIGAAVVIDGKVAIQVHNKAVPTEQMNYVEGDPRSDFSKGVNVDLSLFIHCEAQLVAEAACKGLSLEGATMYVTTFPCPTCAKLVAYSGIKKLYYADGYGVLDGERVLKSQGVEIVFVDSGCLVQ